MPNVNNVKLDLERKKPKFKRPYLLIWLPTILAFIFRLIALL